MDLATLITGIVCLIAGLVIGMMFANDHWGERLFLARGREQPMMVEGYQYYVFDDERYRELLIADVFHKRAVIRENPLFNAEFMSRVEREKAAHDLQIPIDGVKTR